MFAWPSWDSTTHSTNAIRVQITYRRIKGGKSESGGGLKSQG